MVITTWSFSNLMRVIWDLQRWKEMSADAIEDEWWLGDIGTAPEAEIDGSSTTKRKRIRTEALGTSKKKRRRRLKADDLVEEPFSTLHSARRQREELSKSLNSATDEELTFKSVCGMSHSVKLFLIAHLSTQDPTLLNM